MGGCRQELVLGPLVLVPKAVEMQDEIRLGIWAARGLRGGREAGICVEAVGSHWIPAYPSVVDDTLGRLRRQ